MNWSAAVSGLSLDDLTTAIGDDPVVILDSLTHPAKTLCGKFVEFKAAPGAADKLAAPLPALSVPMWAAFFQDDAVDKNEVPFSTAVLSPLGINTAIQELKRLDFDMREYSSAGSLATAIETFVMANKAKAGALAMRPAYLQLLSPGATATHPKGTSAYFKDVTLCSLTDPMLIHD